MSAGRKIKKEREAPQLSDNTEVISEKICIGLKWPVLRKMAT